MLSQTNFRFMLLLVYIEFSELMQFGIYNWNYHL